MTEKLGGVNCTQATVLVGCHGSLRKHTLIPYSFIKEALGHEIAHHLNRQNPSGEKEKSAQTTALKYVYPSLGIFQPLMRLASLLFRKKHSKPDG